MLKPPNGRMCVPCPTGHMFRFYKCGGTAYHARNTTCSLLGTRTYPRGCIHTTGRQPTSAITRMALPRHNERGFQNFQHFSCSVMKHNAMHPTGPSTTRVLVRTCGCAVATHPPHSKTTPKRSRTVLTRVEYYFVPQLVSVPAGERVTGKRWACKCGPTSLLAERIMHTSTMLHPCRQIQEHA